MSNYPKDFFDIVGNVILKNVRDDDHPEGKCCQVKRSNMTREEIIRNNPARVLNYEDLDSAEVFGIILNDDIILYDVDIPEHVEYLEKLLVSEGIKHICEINPVKKTAHFYFKRPKDLKTEELKSSSRNYAPIGICYDIKQGIKKDLSFLKKYNPSTKQAYEGQITHFDNDLDELPEFLFIRGNSHRYFLSDNKTLNKHVKSYFGRKEGTGREDDLFSSIYFFKEICGLSREKTIQYATLISKYFFDDHLTPDRINHQFREEVWNKCLNKSDSELYTKNTQKDPSEYMDLLKQRAQEILNRVSTDDGEDPCACFKKPIEEVMNEDIKLEEGVFYCDNYPPLHGVLADLANNYMTRVYNPIRKCAYVASLTFGSVICGRNYKYMGVFSNLYTVLLAESGFGKNDLVTIFDIWADEVQCPSLVIPGGSFSSDSAVHTAIYNFPQALTVIDEYGRTQNTGNDPIKDSARSELTKIFTSSGSKWAKGKCLSSKNPPDDPRSARKSHPSLSLVGIATFEQMEDILDDKNFVNGEMSRYLFIKVEKKDTYIKNIHEDIPLSEKTINAIQKILSNGNIELDIEGKQEIAIRDAGTYKKPTDIKGELSKDELQYYRLKGISTAGSCNNGALGALVLRRLEKAKKLALISTLCNEEKRVTKKTLDEWYNFIEISDSNLKASKDKIGIYRPVIINKGKAIVEYICKNAMSTGKNEYTKEDFSKNNLKVRDNDIIELDSFLASFGICNDRIKISTHSGASIKKYFINI